MAVIYSNFRTKKVLLPVAYVTAACLLIIFVATRIFSTKPSVENFKDTHANIEQPTHQPTAILDEKKLSEIAALQEKIEKELLRLQNLKGNPKNAHLQAELVKDIHDYEKSIGLKAKVSQTELLSLPRPNRNEVPDVLIRPNFGVCKAGMEPLFVVMVHTRASEIGYRNAIRETWYNPTKSHTKFLNTKPYLWKVIFTTGIGSGENLQREIAEEAKDYGDILQFRFADNKYTGTKKTIGAFTEMSTNTFFSKCKPRFLLKVTDDTFINMPAFVHWLVAKFPKDTKNLYLGHTVHSDTPDRNPNRFPFVPQEQYPFKVFPDYNKNPVYLMSWNLIDDIVQEINAVQPIAADDAYIGIMLARLGLQPTYNDHFVMLDSPMDVCMHLRMFFISHLPPIEVLNVFKRNSMAKHLDECKDVLPYHKIDL